MLCVLIRIASMRDSNENTQHTFMLQKIKEFLLCLWPGAIINPHWLELTLSRTNIHGLKGVRAIKVRLYLPLPI